MTREKNLLLVYPHNYYDLDSGINTRMYELAKYLKSRAYKIDQLGLANFVTDWNRNPVTESSELVDNLYLYDFALGNRSLKKKLKKLFLKDSGDLVR